MDKHRDCASSCSSKRHVDELTAAATRASTAQLLALLPRCSNHLKGKDSLDRTVMHVAASCGKFDVIRWLLRRRGAPVNEPDGESGWTPLHRAIYYGQLSSVRLLLSNGASLSSPRDLEGLSPIDLLAKDKFPHIEFSASEPGQVFTWGSNLNYTLGHPVNQSKEVPDCVESLRKSSVAVTSATLGKFHSAFLSTDGGVFVCGYGQGGRLGIGKGENLSCLVPRRVESLNKEKCVQVAIGQDHSLFLTESGSLWGCGSNAKGQLGFIKSPGGNVAPLSTNEPKAIALKFLKGEKIDKIACGKEFSVLIAGKYSLYGCGVNHGQFGFVSPLKSSDSTLTSQLADSCNVLENGFVFLKVSSLIAKEKTCEIVDVVCVESAMAVSTKRGDIYLVANHKLRKIETPKYFTPDVICLSANKSLDAVANNVSNNSTNTTSNNVANISYHVLVKTMTGKLFSWRTGDPTMRRCLFKESLGGREIYIMDVCLSRQGFLCVAEGGFAYSGTFAAGKPKEVSKVKDSFQAPSNSKKERQTSGGGNKPNGNKKSPSYSPMASCVTSANNSASVEFSHPMVPFLKPEECQRVIVKRVPYVTRAVRCTCDPKGENFAVLQCHPANGVTQIIDLAPSEMSADFRSFFSDSCCATSSSPDVTHDVVLKVANTEFYAHKFILASRCEYFRKLFEKETKVDSTPQIEETNDNDIGQIEKEQDEEDDEGDDLFSIDDSVEEETSFYDLNSFVGGVGSGGKGGGNNGGSSGDPILFSHLLEFLYTDSCDFLREGKQIPPLLQSKSTKQQQQQDDDWMFDEEDLTKSAYSVLKGGGSAGGKGKKDAKGSKKKGGSTSSSGSGGNNNKSTSGNPLDAMKALTKRFGLKALSKQLDSVYLDDQRIVNKIKYKTLNPPKLKFEKTKHKWAYDVILKSEDGVHFPCHRCVLVARLEFFAAMFSSGWLEMSTTTESRSGQRCPKNALPMPFNADVLGVILRFVYADDAPELNDADRADLCFHVLIAADQLLIARLKSLCEVAIAEHVMTLRNAADCLQFAVTYNAYGLRERAAQFLCLNLATVLEKKALDGLTNEAMEHLTKTYQSSHPAISYRRMTPHHVEVDLSRFDASGKPDYISLMEEEDDLKVEEILDDDDDGGGTKGKTASAKKKRERKVSWNDGGISRDAGSDRRRKSSTSEHVGGPTIAGTLLSSKIKGGGKMRTTSVDEESFEMELNESMPVSPTTTSTTGGRRSLSPIADSTTSSTTAATATTKVGNSTATVNNDKSNLSSSGPAPISKSFFDSYVNSVERNPLSSRGLRSVMAEQMDKSGENESKSINHRNGGGGGVGGGGVGDNLGVSPRSPPPSMPKLSWASKSREGIVEEEAGDAPSVSPAKEDGSSSALSKSFKELMIEDLKRDGKEERKGNKTRTMSASVADEAAESQSKQQSHSAKSSKRKISFGLLGDHQQQQQQSRATKEKSKSKETIPEEAKTPSNPWTNFQSKMETTGGGDVGGGAAAAPLSPVGKSSFGIPSTSSTKTSSSSSTAASAAAVSLSRVIHEEAEAKERWKRETQKPLHLIQIEEQALKELQTHYELVYGRDGEETIEVERAVEEYQWTPLWRNASKATS